MTDAEINDVLGEEHWWNVFLKYPILLTALAVIIGLCILVVIIRGILIATRPR